MPATPLTPRVGGLPPCPWPSTYSSGNVQKTASQATCATWDPAENTDPPGCDLVHPAAGAAVRGVALAAALAALAAAGCGGAVAGGSGPLVWTAPPVEFTPETLPGERIVTGELRNEGLRRLRVDLPDLRIRDATGDDVEAQPIFLQTFGKSLWSPGRGPAEMPETELVRTGRIAWLDPGETVPLTIAWREPAAPARVEYDGGWVPIP